MLIGIAACSSAPSASGGKTGSGGTAGTTGTAGTAGTGRDDGRHGGSTGTAGTGVSGGAPGSCEAFGHFGTPTVTFALPVQGVRGGQDAGVRRRPEGLPMVPWATLERLYLPAGSYTNIQIGNLPVRDPAHPLVITNQGGQVFVGNNPRATTSGRWAEARGGR